ncbi:MAG: hypothetical protein ACJ75R_07765, partial [Solirubrobacterales bacterium]
MLRGAVSAAAVVISLLCASAASADYDSPSISQSDSADPVLEGATVTYTMTVTNTFGAPEHLQLDTLLV